MCFRFLLPLVLLSSSAFADGREPGSLVLFPEFDNRGGVATIYTLTNTSETEDVVIEIIYRGKRGLKGEELNCLEFNATHTLTPLDTWTFITGVNNPEAEQGYAYAFAKEAGTEEPISFNRLIAHMVVVDGMDMLQYGINSLVLASPVAHLGLTDLDSDGIRDLDGREYGEVADIVHVPRFFGQTDPKQGRSIGGELILVGLSGGIFFDTTLNFSIYNDSEEGFSRQYTFDCWDKVPLLDISNAFSQEFLYATSSDNSSESLGSHEYGWFSIDGGVANSSFVTIQDPAFLAAYVERIASSGAADLPFEVGQQDNGDLLPVSVGGDGPSVPLGPTVGSFSGFVFAIATPLDGSGDVYYGGNFTAYEGTAAPGLARLNEDGTIDTGFNLGLGFNSQVNAIAPAQDGSGDIFVGGSFTLFNTMDANGLVRLNDDGSVDMAFDIGTGFDFEVRALAAATDGSGDIYAGGFFSLFDGTPVGGIVRLDPDGSLDAGFERGSGFSGAFGRGIETLVATTDGSGDVFAGGVFQAYQGVPAGNIARIDSDGSIDTGFLAPGPGVLYGADENSSEVVQLDPANGAGTAVGIHAESSIVGMAFDVNTRTLYGATFGPERLVVVDTVDGSTTLVGPLAQLAAGLAYDPMENVLYGSGFFTREVLRIDPQTGTILDSVPQVGVDTGIVGLAFDPRTRTLYGSSLQTDELLIIDPVTGMVTVVGPLGFGEVRGLAFDPSTGTLFGSNTATTELIAIDTVTGQGTSVGPIGRSVPGLAFEVGVANGAFDGRVRALALSNDASGDVFAAGEFLAYDGTPSRRLARLDANGALDLGFNVGMGLNSTPFALAAPLDGSGDIVVGGAFTDYDGALFNRIVRLDADGSIDATFDPGTGFNFSVRALAPAVDGSEEIYAGGVFFRYNGMQVDHGVTLDPDGSVD